MEEVVVMLLNVKMKLEVACQSVSDSSSTLVVLETGIIYKEANLRGTLPL